MTILPDDLHAWYEHGDRDAGDRVVHALAARVALPASFARALGKAVAQEVEQDALVRLLDRERRLLLHADDPLAFAATVARNLARDTLRRHRRRGDLGERASIDDLPHQAAETREPGRRLDAERALSMLRELGDDARLAVLLVHAPDRMPGAGWELLAARQRGADTPERRGSPLDRDEASRLLWPPPVPETRAARRRRLERIRKVLSRAYARLAQALGEP